MLKCSCVECCSRSKEGVGDKSQEKNRPSERTRYKTVVQQKTEGNKEKPTKMEAKAQIGGIGRSRNEQKRNSSVERRLYDIP